MIEHLNNAEYDWFLWLNGHHSPFFDVLMHWISYKFTWIPLYLFLIVLIFRTFPKKQAFQQILFLLIVVGCSDYLASGIIKPFFQRPRPCHDPVIGSLVHIVDGCGGMYGFVSSHASTSFGLAFGIIFVFGWLHPISKFMLIWAIIVSYSRIYLGVHYFSDIFLGGLVGVFFAFLFQLLRTRIIKT